MEVWAIIGLEARIQIELRSAVPLGRFRCIPGCKCALLDRCCDQGRSTELSLADFGDKRYRLPDFGSVCRLCLGTWCPNTRSAVLCCGLVRWIHHFFHFFVRGGRSRPRKNVEASCALCFAQLGFMHWRVRRRRPLWAHLVRRKRRAAVG